MNCDLFNSCKKTKYASQVVAMSNAIGFTTFQGTEAYRKAPIFINLDYEKDRGLDYDIDLCNTTSVNNMWRGFHVDEDCKCNSCEKSCFYSAKASLPVLEGFSLITVAVIYLTVLILTIIIYICKCVYKKNNPTDSSRSSSIYTEYLGQSQDSSKMNSQNSRNNINRVNQ